MELGQRLPLGLLRGLGDARRSGSGRCAARTARGEGWKRRAVELQRLRGAAAARSGGRRRRACPSRRPAGRSSRRSRAARSAAPTRLPGWRGARAGGPATARPTPAVLHHREHVVDVLGEAGDRLVVDAAGPWRSAQLVTGSVPGARPMPRSIRPGYAASSRANCSATTSGAWLGSITPPEPTRMRSVGAGDQRDQHRRVGRGHAGHVVVLGHPVAPVAGVVGGRARDRVAASASPVVWSLRTGTRSSTERARGQSLTAGQRLGRPSDSAQSIPPRPQRGRFRLTAASQRRARGRRRHRLALGVDRGPVRRRVGVRLRARGPNTWPSASRARPGASAEANGATARGGSSRGRPAPAGRGRARGRPARASRRRSGPRPARPTAVDGGAAP